MNCVMEVAGISNERRRKWGFGKLLQREIESGGNNVREEEEERGFSKFISIPLSESLAAKFDEKIKFSIYT